MHFHCTGLTIVKFNKELQEIGKRAFQGCSSLNELDFGDATNLKTIQRLAFDGCKALTTATIPSSVTSFGDDVIEDSL